MLTPLASMGTRIMLCWRWAGPSVRVLPMKIHSLQRGSMAPGSQPTVSMRDNSHIIIGDSSTGGYVVTCTCKYRDTCGNMYMIAMAVSNVLGYTRKYTAPSPLVHHFSPLMTYSSPSRRIELSMFVASDDATFNCKTTTTKIINIIQSQQNIWRTCMHTHVPV